jgi:hypothetical protein
VHRPGPIDAYHGLNLMDELSDHCTQEQM